MMARLLRWFERKAPWVRTLDDTNYYAEMENYQRQAERGEIEATVRTENFLSQMFKENGSNHPRLPANRP